MRAEWRVQGRFTLTLFDCSQRGLRERRTHSALSEGVDMLMLMIAATVSVSLVAERLMNHVCDNYVIEWVPAARRTGIRRPNRDF